MSEPATIGFIGLGNMGGPMAANIAAAGFDLVCFDAAGTESRLPDGGRAAASATDLFRAAHTVFLSLPDGRIVLEVVETLAATAERAVSVVCDLSTVGPATATTAASALTPVGVTYVDCPVSGGRAGAIAGTVSLMYAGPATILDDHRAVFDAIAGNVFDVGEQAGMGQTMKLLNNVLSATALAATSEAAAFGVAHGLDLAQIIDVLNVSTGRNSATDDKFPNRVLTGTYDSGFHTRLMAKDVDLFVSEAVRAGTSAQVIGTVLDVWRAADLAMPDSDFTEIWKYVSRRATAHDSQG